MVNVEHEHASHNAHLYSGVHSLAHERGAHERPREVLDHSREPLPPVGVDLDAEPAGERDRSPSELAFAGDGWEEGGAEHAQEETAGSGEAEVDASREADPIAEDFAGTAGLLAGVEARSASDGAHGRYARQTEHSAVHSPRPYISPQESRDQRLILIMKKHGIDYPEITLHMARATHIPLSLACAILEKETSGGENVFGHDPVRSGQVVGGRVTKRRYLHYKRLRKKGYGNQGVGPMQLTDPSLQDRADRLGGCWKVSVNIKVGLEFLHGLIKQYGSTFLGVVHYNGSGSAAYTYGRDVIRKQRRWHSLLTR